MSQTADRPIENTLPVDELLTRADHGDADCQYWAGLRYFLAKGLPKDDDAAFCLCSAAAEQGHARAQAFVAYCYGNGISVSSQLRLSARWYRQSAEQGYAPAQFSLGNYYLAGSGAKKNIKRALYWLDKAAIQGNVEAQLKLGNIHHYGWDVVQNDPAAFPYYLAAAEQDSAAAQYMVSMLFAQGSGVEHDLVEAFLWLDRSAAQGYLEAVETKGEFEVFVTFDATQLKPEGVTIGHEIPVKRRTLALMEFLGRPCLQTMAHDIYEFVSRHPRNAETGFSDIAKLLEAASQRGEVLLPIGNLSLPPDKSAALFAKPDSKTSGNKPNKTS